MGNRPLLQEDEKPRFRPGRRFFRTGDEVLMDREYRYWAWLDEDESSMDHAREIIRTWTNLEGFTRNESHTPDGWKNTGTYWDVKGQHLRGHLLPITAEDVERLTRR
jgi:hypothetical protein